LRKRGNQSGYGTRQHGKTPVTVFYNLTLAPIRHTVHIFALFSALLLPHPCHAAQNELTRQSIDLILDEKWEKARETVTTSHDRSLYDFYEWALYRSDATGLPFNRIASFIQKHPDWPNQRSLLASAEKNMNSALGSSQIMDWFTLHPPVTGEGMLKLLSAAEAPPDKSRFMRVIITSWPHATISLTDQNRLFDLAGKAIPLSSHDERLDVLLGKNQYSLARALAKKIGNGYPELIEARIALIEKKTGASTLVARIPKHLLNNPGLMLNRITWRRAADDTQGAIALTNTLPASISPSLAAALWKERSILVRRMIEEKNFQKAYSLAAHHSFSTPVERAEAEWLSGWIALRFLKNPENAQTHFQTMYGNVETAISKARGAYWLARAAHDLGQSKIEENWYQIAANYPHTYYGQLALKHLGRKASYPALPLTTPADMAKITNSTLLHMADILHDTGHETLSGTFIQAKTDSLKTPSEFLALALHMKKRGDITGAYLVAKKASWKNFYIGDTALPDLSTLMATVTTDKALVHGVIRQESQFDPEARSPSGALGLMQLMPPTARETAQKLGINHQTPWLTSKPSHNITLGAAYLQRLLTRFDNSYPLAIAAYNAGPRRVDEWLTQFGDPRAGQVDWVDWIELIPVAETRNYVQRVTEGTILYRDHLPRSTY